MKNVSRLLTLAGAALGISLLSGCWERPPIDTYQRGFRGTAMVQVNNPRDVAKQVVANQVPEVVPPVVDGGPLASTIYKNVQVLGGVSVGEFTRTMVSMTNWIAPNEGCNYCHKAGEGFEADTLYTKVVARKMLQMTQAINVDNKARGQHIPANVWFTPPPAKSASKMTGGDGLQNKASEAVGLASLPADGLTPFLSKAMDIRVAGTTPLPMKGETRNTHTTKQTEWTYSLMVHMSTSLGVNCTYCHNTQSFGNWETSTPQRVTAWHGIRMARSLNNDYMESLTNVFPASRKGAGGDVAKVGCSTCHAGAYKPLYGAQMAKDFPALINKTDTPEPAAKPQKVAATK
jgi:photosynthetic reaction center cytochrome c subunit